MKALFTKLSVDLYYEDILLSFCQSDLQFLRSLRQYPETLEYLETADEGDPDPILRLPPGVQARVCMIPGYGTCARFAFYPTDTWEAGIFAHEIFHIAVKILAARNLFLVRESEEAYAYLIGHLTEKVYGILQKRVGLGMGKIADPG